MFLFGTAKKAFLSYHDSVKTLKYFVINHNVAKFGGLPHEKIADKIISIGHSIRS